MWYNDNEGNQSCSWSGEFITAIGIILFLGVCTLWPG